MPDTGEASVEAQGTVLTPPDEPHFVSVHDLLTVAAAHQTVEDVVTALGGTGSALPPWVNMSGVAHKCLTYLDAATHGGATMTEAIDAFNAMYPDAQMPTIANLNGGVGASAVTDDDVFVGLDGAVAKKFLATVVRAYMTAVVSSDITAIQTVNATQTTNIATNTSGLSTLNGTVANMALSTTNAQTANYTFVLTDGQIPFVTVTMNVATANTLTIPPNASVAFPIGTILAAEQWGAGTTTWTAGAGVTIRSRGAVVAMGGQWAAASARKIATNEWLLSGDLV